jgi:hypothetical protein
MSNSISGSSGPTSSLLAAILGMAFASYASASDLKRDEDGFGVAALELRADDYPGFERMAVRCRDGPQLLDRFDGTQFLFDWFISKQLISLREGSDQWHNNCARWLALAS